MLLCTGLNAQQHDEVWMFGYESYTNTDCFGGSVLDFGTNPVDTFYEYRDMNLDVTNASICDTAGNLLFYTNGIYIANALHEPMENGEGLNPGEFADDHQLYGYILNQGAIIIPKPESDSLYYLFHASREYSNNQIGGHSPKLYYSLVDMSQNNGLGAVIEKNTIVIDDILTLGRLTATKHSNGRDWWLLLRKYSSNMYYRILLTPSGLLNLGIQEIGDSFNDGIGQAVFSPNGKKYVVYNARLIEEGNHLNIYDFDRCTGLLSNQRQTVMVDSAYALGTAISPNSRFLYLSSYNYIYQYDLEAADILATKDTVAIYDGYLEEVAPTIHIPTQFFLMQLAPDGKIYINLPATLKILHVINNPDVQGEACDVAQHSVRLPTYNAFSLPNFPNYRLGKEVGVDCDTITAVSDITKRPLVFRVYPNPTTGKLNLKIDSGYNEGQELQIFDLAGKQVKRYTLSQGKQLFNFDLSSLDAGIYFYECILNGEKITGKIILLN